MVGLIPFLLFSVFPSEASPNYMYQVRGEFESISKDGRTLVIRSFIFGPCGVNSYRVKNPATFRHTLRTDDIDVMVEVMPWGQEVVTVLNSHQRTVKGKIVRISDDRSIIIVEDNDGHRKEYRVPDPIILTYVLPGDDVNLVLEISKSGESTVFKLR